MSTMQAGWPQRLPGTLPSWAQAPGCPSEKAAVQQAGSAPQELMSAGGEHRHSALSGTAAARPQHRGLLSRWAGAAAWWPGCDAAEGAAGAAGAAALPRAGDPAPPPLLWSALPSRQRGRLQDSSKRVFAASVAAGRPAGHQQAGVCCVSGCRAACRAPASRLQQAKAARWTAGERGLKSARKSTAFASQASTERPDAGKELANKGHLPNARGSQAGPSPGGWLATPQVCLGVSLPDPDKCTAQLCRLAAQWQSWHGGVRLTAL